MAVKTEFVVFWVVVVASCSVVVGCLHLRQEPRKPRILTHGTPLFLILRVYALEIGER
jgi:hypothetical protein